ncbi:MULTISPECIES: LuxR family transcriptional regulator [unclassified Shinella]|uniref:LuxR family transcriptional regulator n=2 Tax=Shinella TaxID=323620 RepID=UPI00102D5BAC|nr:LuxR C-terminal-related transcriptional regulator [Shinella sp. HY16]MDC7269618.1 LuxR C-terminal-related transcriptional regulator [Shinella sp. YZ44]TAA62588.1 LuxR family transcriptional regulator [Shinella sp. JR1-6]
MRVDFTALFHTLADWTGAPENADRQTSDRQTGETLLAMMRALVRFDDIVIFAYHEKARPIDLFSTFDADDHHVFVTLYQAGPYLLDPFYRTTRAGRAGIFRMRELAPDRFFSSEYFRTYYSQTRLAEELGFFVPVEGGVTVVVSLMRREKTGVFPVQEFALLSDTEPFVAALVRRAWSGLGERFAETGQGRGRRSEPVSAADRVWRKLNLTDREASIIELVLQGHSSESIGLKLDISTGTVKVHRRNVYRKLGISSQIQLLSIYLKNLQG